MQTKREYLISKGLAQPGRGRFSREGNAAIEKAISEGVKFKDATPAPVKRVAKSTGPVAKSDGPTDSTESGYGMAFLRYGKMDMQFEGVDSNGKRHVVSGRNACSCGYSLVGHTCDDATALVAGGERISVHPIV